MTELGDALLLALRVLGVVVLLGAILVVGVWMEKRVRAAEKDDERWR